MMDAVNSTKQGSDYRVDKGKNIKDWHLFFEIIPEKNYAKLFIKKPQSKDDGMSLEQTAFFLSADIY